MIQGRLYPYMVKTPCPDKACGNPHEDIKYGPHGCKDPVRWIKEGLVEGNIPVIYRRLYHNTGEEADEQANRYRNNDIEYFFFQMAIMYKTNVVIKFCRNYRKSC